MIYQIIAYKGAFSTVEEAAYAEKQVNWQDASLEECTVCTESFAALDLKNILETKKNIQVKVSELGELDFDGDVLVFVGQRSAAEACKIFNLNYVPLEKEEEYRICGRVVGDKQIVLIYGGSRAGTLYGASAYMEYHGIRFVAPGDRGTSYHTELDLSAEKEFDISEAPSFDVRECYSESMYDTNYDFLLWLVHSRLNYVFMDTIYNPERMHKLCLAMSGGGHTLWYEYMDTEHEYPYKHPIFGGDGKPDDPYPVSPLYKGDINGDGILTYGEAHPEWYAETDGERKLSRNHEAYNDRGYATGDFICTSNEDAVTEMCRLLVESLADGALKHVSRLNLYGLDNGTWCECENCSKDSYTYRTLMLAYKLDKTIKKATEEGKINRKILILCVIYHETLPAPEKPLPDDFDYNTIYGELAVIERCYVHNIDDKGCVESNKLLYDRLMSWVESEHYKGNVGIIEYYNVAIFASMPFILTERMFYDIPFYHSVGVERMKYMHMTTSHRGVREVNDYVYSKLLWNVNYDGETLKHEYFISKYGEYADKMRQIYDELESACANCKLIKHYQFIDNRYVRLDMELNNNKEVTVFNYNHMKFDGRADDYQAGPSLTETVTRFEACFNEFCAFIKDKDYSIFEEDYDQLEYGLCVLKYIYYNVLPIMDKDAEVKEQITYYAEKLKKITKPLEGYDIRDRLFKDGLMAARVVYEQ